MNASNLQTDSNARTPNAKKQYSGRFHEKKKLSLSTRPMEYYLSMWTERRFYNILFSIFSRAQSGRWSCMSCSRTIHKIAKQATICSSFMIAKWQSTDERNTRGGTNVISVRIHRVEKRTASYSHIQKVQTNRSWRWASTVLYWREQTHHVCKMPSRPLSLSLPLSLWPPELL